MTNRARPGGQRVSSLFRLFSRLLLRRPGISPLAYARRPMVAAVECTRGSMRRRGAMRHIGVVTQASEVAGVLTQGRRWASRIAMSPDLRGAAVLVGTVALLVYVLPGLSAPA